MNSSTDIVVVGAGAAGIAAAVSAARAGCRTVLIDRHAGPGGTGGLSGLTTLCGLFDDSGSYLNEGFAREFADALTEVPPIRMGKVWVLPYRPETFRKVASRLIAAEPNLETRWDESLTEVRVQDDRIVSLNGIDTGAVIDCSGYAEVALAAGTKCLATDESTQASAVVFELGNVERLPGSPAEMASVLLPLARAGFPMLSFQPNLNANSLTAKFSGRPEEVPALVSFLRENAAGFDQCETRSATLVATPRSGRMIVGRHLLSGAEVLAGQKFSDAVARCAWPIEQWNTQGVARFRYLPSGLHYEIPARSLQASRLENLFMAGKTVSADVEAIASARVMGCCLATGAAAGLLAASHLQSRSTA